MSVKTLAINEQLVSAREEQTVLEAAQDAGIYIPSLCYLVRSFSSWCLSAGEIAYSNDCGY